MLCSALKRICGLRRKSSMTGWTQSLVSPLIHVPAQKTENAKSSSLKKKTVFLKTGGGERVFCNPPYGRGVTEKWVQKSYAESRKPNTLVVCLLPARTDTRWFHDFVLNKAEVRFVRGRLKFGAGKDAAPFPSIVVIYGGQMGNSSFAHTVTALAPP